MDVFKMAMSCDTLSLSISAKGAATSFPVSHDYEVVGWDTSPPDFDFDMSIVRSKTVGKSLGSPPMLHEGEIVRIIPREYETREGSVKFHLKRT